jgi:DNA-binding NarL/FixJ family response regulator
VVGHIGLHRYGPGPAFSAKDLFKARFLSTLLSRNLIQQQLIRAYFLLDAGSDTCRRISLRHPENLTSKEMEIVQYISQGLTNKEISDKLYISLSTVATHIQHIFRKLGINNRSRLISRLS